MTDLDLAFVFLDIARTSRDQQTRRRNRENARKVYHAVTYFLPRLTPTVEEKRVIEQKASELKRLLEAYTESVDS